MRSNLAVLILIVVGAIRLGLLSKREPVYHGKHLNQRLL